MRSSRIRGTLSFDMKGKKENDSFEPDELVKER